MTKIDNGGLLVYYGLSLYGQLIALSLVAGDAYLVQYSIKLIVPDVGAVAGAAVAGVEHLPHYVAGIYGHGLHLQAGNIEVAGVELAVYTCGVNGGDDEVYANGSPLLLEQGNYHILDRVLKAQGTLW